MSALYNPFGDKRLSELTEEDLQQLIPRGVAEGHYVEYKSTAPSAAKIAKSVSAFANTHGGWLFLGLEADEHTNLPTRVPGLDLSTYGNLPDTIRHAVVAHLDPQPGYEDRCVPLSDGRIVVVVRTPEGDSPPYIHSDGRMYRRHGAGSDPVFEKDRHTVDQLYVKARKVHEQFRDFAALPWQMSKAQSNSTTGWLELYIMPEHPGDLADDAVWKAVETSPTEHLAWWSSPVEWKSADDQEVVLTVSAPFDQFVATVSGYCVSQAPQTPDPSFLPLVVDVTYTGATRTFIPMQALSEDALEQAHEELMKDLGDSAWQVRPFDGHALCRGALIMLMKCAQYAHEQGATGGLRTKVRLCNCWKALPCFPGKPYKTIVDALGWPISRCSEHEIPPALADRAFAATEVKTPGLYGIGMLSPILQALGIPYPYVGEITGICAVSWKDACAG